VPFHPCGMVLDMQRVCYRTKMRLWRDSDELTPVYWHRTQPGAKVFHLPHRFASWKTWLRPLVNDGGMGEQNEHFGYYKGGNPVGYAGQRHCGSDDAMSRGGQHGIDPVLTTGTDGWLACCGPMPVCGVAIPDRWRVRWESPAGCSCMGVIDLLCPLDVAATIPGVVYYWNQVVHVPGTNPWGEVCTGGFTGYVSGMTIRLVVGDCAWQIVPRWVLNGLINITRTATPVLSDGPDGPQLVADTDDPPSWATYAPGTVIWSVGDCEIAIDDPARRWVITATPEYIT